MSLSNLSYFQTCWDGPSISFPSISIYFKAYWYSQGKPTFTSNKGSAISLFGSVHAMIFGKTICTLRFHWLALLSCCWDYSFSPLIYQFKHFCSTISGWNYVALSLTYG